MILAIFFVLLILVLYLYNVRTFSYWKRRGIKYEEPALFFGTYKKVLLGKQSRSQMTEDLYWKYPNEDVVGGFKTTTPELIVRNPELIKDVLITDFSSFYRRGLVTHKTVIEPLRKHLFALDGDLWRLLRQRMTPAFTSGKLKAMFPLIVERAEKLQSYTLAAATQNRPLNARDLMARFTTDFIGACGFGIDSQSLNEENSEFRKLGARIFTFTTRDVIVNMLKEIFPELFKNFKLLVRIEKDILGLVKQIQMNRNYQPSGRNDFVDLLLACQKKGVMEGESLEKLNPDGTPAKVSAELDDDLFAAQVFVFFGAGFETSASSTSYTLHQLAFHPEVQKKVQDEIDSVLDRYNGKLCYEAVKEMTYLDWAFKEGLRMFPSLGFLMRQSTSKYTFRGLNLTIDEDVSILIPVQSLHMDSKYWDNPEEFRPERFDPDNFSATQKLVYFPFGEGPRNCIGSRLGLMQSLAGLAAILSKFTVEPAPESTRHVKVNPKSNIVQGVKNNQLPLMFRERKSH
ncbi:cytochrome P450 6B6-like [Ostrinia furnacalis]|uniref:cytochrome P450 6B6-like n=1 Tax=Ostrinia furnacalis TaxID=93504 RepID=UPI00103ED43F|nr:cytochrome P450 6B6-like [Ostrinia furnacalis]